VRYAAAHNWGQQVHFHRVKRREFIALLGSAASWPLAARGQQGERMRRVGVLMLYPEHDSEGQLRATALRQGLQKLGWVEGRNVQIDIRWGVGDGDWIKLAAEQLLQLAPDMILANGTPAARTMQQASRTVPVIFIAGSDPVLDGLVPSLAHPGGNLTGFYVFEPSLGAKLVELLKEIAPQLSRVAILSNPDANPASWVASAVAAAPKFAVEVVSAPLHGPNEIEAAMAQWGREPNFGLIVVPDPATNAHRKLINELAMRHRLPVIHALRAAGGRPDVLRRRPSGRVPANGRICRSHLQGYQPRRPADLSADQVRAGYQSHNRKGIRHGRPAVSDAAG
jgi:putative ABC transport system substrate-binding protein